MRDGKIKKTRVCGTTKMKINFIQQIEKLEDRINDLKIQVIEKKYEGIDSETLEELQEDVDNQTGQLKELKREALRVGGVRFKINDYKFIIESGKFIVDGPDDDISRKAGQNYIDMLDGDNEEMINDFFKFILSYNKVIEYLELPEVE